MKFRNLKTEMNNTKQGFSVVELAVVMGIFMLLTTAILVNHGRFGSSILVGNLAYDIALSVRQAQVFGLSVKEYEAGTGEFHDGYGVHFSGADDLSYVLFADRNMPPNLRYDAGLGCGVVGDECIEKFTITGGNKIKDLCGILTGGVEKCVSTGDINYLDIIFIRPDPDAELRSNVIGDMYSSVRITIVSPRNEERDILIYVTGQISVK